MSPKPIDDLAILVDNLYYPLLTNPLNQKGWTETLSKDMETHLQELRNTIAEVIHDISNVFFCKISKNAIVSRFEYLIYVFHLKNFSIRCVAT